MLRTWHLGLASPQISINGGGCYYDYDRAGTGFGRSVWPAKAPSQQPPEPLAREEAW